MAKCKPGSSGQFYGKIGDVVLYKRKGKMLSRDVPSKTTKKPTSPQKNQRAKFKFVVAFLKPFTPSISKGFGNSKSVLTTMNKAVKYNFKHALRVDGKVLSMVYEEVMITDGTLDALYDPEAVSGEGGLISLDWVVQLNLKHGVDENDMVCLHILYEDMDRNNSAVYADIAPRSAGIAEVKIQNIYAGKNAHIWIFVTAADGKSVSKSEYLGRHMIGA